MAQISVIIPVYNVAAYLPTCLASVCQQTFPDLEIILVDDGSIDESGLICDTYARQDSKIRVIHKVNGGLSSARNAGLKICTSPYVAFVDSDDYIALDLYELLYGALQKTGADLAMCDIAIIRDNTDEADQNISKMNHGAKDAQYKVFQGQLSIFTNLFGPKYEQLGIGTFNKLYKTGIFYDLHFLEGKFCEDAFISVPLLLKIQRIVYVPEATYFYKVRPDSIMKDANRLKLYEDAAEAAKLGVQLLSKKGKAYRQLGEYRLWNIYRWIFDTCTFEENDSAHMAQDVRMFLSKHIYEILNNAYIRWITRLDFILLSYCLPGYKTLHILHILKNKYQHRR